MKKYKLLLFFTLLLIPAISFADRKERLADEATQVWEYEVEPLVVGTQGSCVIKVWSVSKSPAVAAAQACKNGVHAVIFKGVPAKDRIPARKPLVSAMEMSEHQSFFNSFFRDGGPYMSFVTLTNNGSVDSDSVLKINKKEYKVGTNVTINYDELKKTLVKEGIIKGLSSGF